MRKLRGFLHSHFATLCYNNSPVSKPKGGKNAGAQHQGMVCNALFIIQIRFCHIANAMQRASEKVLQMK